MRMNRLVVRQAAAGLPVEDPLGEAGGSIPDAARRGVVIAHDARRKSDHFAEDTARVLAALGVRAMLHPGVQPTPVLAWSITGLAAAAGVVVTASHNPPADNGYKVYLATGSQIVAPIDSEISERIARFDPLSVELAPADHELIERLGTEWVDRYVDFVPSVRLRPDVAGVPVAYTAMHGVGGAVLLRAFDAAGFDPPYVVAQQQEPDGTFPTVAFPNPEEPGAMDLLLETARQCGAAVALANDPDADRLGVAIPQPDGSWRRLSGDEIGWLFADHILAHTEGDDRLVVTTLVSSSLLGRMADAAGVHGEETFTGFKWIGKIATERPELRLVLGYEQALGYLVAPRPLDKDGISAAVLMAEITAVAVADGVTLQDRLDAIAERFGHYVTAELSVKMPPADGAAWVAALEAAPPSEVGGRRVEQVTSYPEAGLVRLVLEGGVRLQIRPSGTEPKVKLYAEAVDLDRSVLLALLEAVTSGVRPQV
jgi:phosphomannomutase